MSIFTRMKVSSANAREFIFFLLLTTLVATLIKLSKEYTTSYSVAVNITNLPIDKTLRSKSVENVEVSINSSGFSLLRNKVDSPEINITFESLIRASDGTYVYNVSDHFEAINSTLEGDTEVLNAKPMRLSIIIDSASSKLIPVKANIEITYAPEYGPNGNMVVVPDSVLVVGPGRLLDKLNSIQTDVLNLSDVSSNVKETVSIKNTGTNNVEDLTYDTKEFLIKQEVAKFVEVSVMVPVEILNKTNATIKILSKTVEVFYTVEEEALKSITASDFRVTCTYGATTKKDDYLSLKLSDKPEKATSVRLVDERVKFMVVN